jgi:hypothetical protein
MAEGLVGRKISARLEGKNVVLDKEVISKAGRRVTHTKKKQKGKGFITDLLKTC